MKVNDIRPISLMGPQAKAMQADIDWLIGHADKFVEVDCPACLSSSKTLIYQKYGMQHVQCDECSTQYISPRPPPEVLSQFYLRSENYKYWASHIFPGSENARRNKIFKPRAKMLLDLLQKNRGDNDFMLEVGAAHGMFCEEVQKLGIFKRIAAIEPNEELAERCKALGLETFEGGYEKVEILEKVSVIASFEVIEHLYNPSHFVQWCHKSLVKDGYLMLTCPNIVGFDTFLLGKLSDSVDHEHLNLFTPASLSILLNKNGFQVEKLLTPGELDVDIVKQALEDNILSSDTVGDFLTKLLLSSDDTVRNNFQKFLKVSQLSSNMMILGRKV